MLTDREFNRFCARRNTGLCALCDERGEPQLLVCMNHKIEWGAWQIDRGIKGGFRKWASEKLMCPKCQVKARASNDYLCEGCRYGHGHT